MTYIDDEREQLRREHEQNSEQVQQVVEQTGWEDHSVRRPGICRPARIGGPGYVSGNGIEIELTHNYNGSGQGYFGGAHKWPALNVHIGFPVECEEEAKELMVKLARLIDENIPTL
jgi:hypothetical protein